MKHSDEDWSKYPPTKLLEIFIYSCGANPDTSSKLYRRWARPKGGGEFRTPKANSPMLLRDDYVAKDLYLNHGRSMKELVKEFGASKSYLQRLMKDSRIIVEKIECQTQT